MYEMTDTCCMVDYSFWVGQEIKKTKKKKKKQKKKKKGLKPSNSDGSFYSKNLTVQSQSK